MTNKTAVDRDPKKTTPAKRRARSGVDTSTNLGVMLKNLPLDSFPPYLPAGCEKVQAHGNCYIVQGLDRTGRESVFTRGGRRLDTPKEVGYGVDGYDGSYIIDLVVGRSSANRVDAAQDKQILVTAPNFDSDAARIYISQLSDIDYTLGLRSSINGVPESKGRSAVAIKADAVRIVGREGIKIVTGVGKDEPRKNSQNGSIGSAKGIDLIANNRIDGAYDLQPIPKGLNLALFGSEFIHYFKMTIDLNLKVIDELEEAFNQIDGHVHNTPMAGAPSAPPASLIVGKATRIASLQGLRLRYKSMKDLLTFLEQDYLMSTGDKYINSINNRTN